MRFPVQALPIFRAFMRNVVGRQWAPAADVETVVEPTAAARRKGQMKRGAEAAATRACLVRLTTFGGAQSRAF